MVGTRVLDLFAGTGGIGIEALSRGARSCLFVDKSHHAVDLIRRNLSICHLADQAMVVQKDITRGLDFLTQKGLIFDLVFLDPPYDKGYVAPTLRYLNTSGCMDAGGAVVVEHGTREDVPEVLTRLKQSRQRRYGKTLVSFYDFVV